MQEDKFNLSPLWYGLFEIYKVIETICKRNGLRVFVAYGSALGAIRHRGFIPWDDDMDVCMPREDFEKFIKLANQELPNWLRVVSWRNCSRYSNIFFKVIVSDKKRVDAIASQTGLPLPEGVFVDVFPIDGYPKTWVGKLTRVIAMGLTRSMMRLTGSSKWYHVVEWVVRRWKYDKSTYVLDWGGWLSEERMFAKFPQKKFLLREDFGDGKEVPFMDGTVIIAANETKYAAFNYGDFMQLPPEEKRVPSHTLQRLKQVSWRFGPY